MRELLDYFKENWRKVLAISIITQVVLAIISLMKDFTTENAERLLFIYFSIGLPIGMSVFLTGLTEILFFLIVGIILFCVNR